ncbi:MAG: GNAT family N-acetyltransferase [Alphaproteobacteria bacterium]
MAAETAADIGAVRTLFREYSHAVDSQVLNVCFKGFEDELARLPGEYGPPAGRLLLSLDGAEAVGCVGMRPLGDGHCEMKRLYVRPAHRGRGLGRHLAEEIVRVAAQAGHRRMVLDTFPRAMPEAVALYERLGFRECDPYYPNPAPGVVCYGLDLAP